MGNLLREEVEALLREHSGGGDFLLGFANLYGRVEGDLSDLIYGVSVGLRLDDGIVDGIVDGPTKRYLDHYREVNRRLDQVTSAIAHYFVKKGARARAIPATVENPSDPEDPYFETLSVPFSHKMAATRAGLGWIGKTALFVSDRFGPRVRLGTVLTDDPLETGTPCEMSLCGDCLVCVEACPANAADGMEWFPGLERDRFFDAFKCREKCRAMTKASTGEDASVCGICVAVCPVGIEFRTSGDEDEWI